MTVKKANLRELLRKHGALPPKEIVKYFKKEDFQEVANALWSMVDCGEIAVTRDEKIKLLEIE